MRVLTSPAETGAVTLALAAGRAGGSVRLSRRAVRAARLDDPAARAGSRSRCRRPRGVFARERAPLIVAGGGVLYSEATDCAALASPTPPASPSARRRRAKARCPFDHPLALGGDRRNRHARRESPRARRRSRDRRRLAAERFHDARRTRRFSTRPTCGSSRSTSPRSTRGSTAACRSSATRARRSTSSESALEGWRVEQVISSSVSGDEQDLWTREVDRIFTHRITRAAHQPGRSHRHPERATAPTDVIVCAAGSLPGDLHKLWRTRDAGRISPGVRLLDAWATRSRRARREDGAHPIGAST